MNQLGAIASRRIITVSPAHLRDSDIAIAAGRAGGLAILDLGYNHQPDWLTTVLDRLVDYCDAGARWGVRWDTLGGGQPATLQD